MLDPNAMGIVKQNGGKKIFKKPNNIKPHQKKNPKETLVIFILVQRTASSANNLGKNHETSKIFSQKKIHLRK